MAPLLLLRGEAYGGAVSVTEAEGADDEGSEKNADGDTDCDVCCL